MCARLCVCVWVSVVSVSLCVSMYGCMCVGVRGQAASLPTMWILRMLLRLSGLVKYLDALSHLPVHFDSIHFEDRE